jgi:hypothetical protein
MVFWGLLRFSVVVACLLVVKFIKGLLLKWYSGGRRLEICFVIRNIGLNVQADFLGLKKGEIKIGEKHG